jgi:hypothetical protein
MPVLLLGNPTGTGAVRRETRFWLARDDEHFILHAEGRETSLTLRPELQPDDPMFWTQDHIELRLLPASGEHVQIIIALNGRCWDNRGLYKQDDRLTCRGEVRDENWTLDLRLNCAALGLAVLPPGMVLRGLVAHVRWADGRPDIACCTAMELGFSQHERLAEFVLDETSPEGPFVSDFRLVDDRQARLTLVNPSSNPFSGRLVWRYERADGDVGTDSIPLNLVPGGRTELTVPFIREPQRFTRLCLAIEDQQGRHEFGAVSLRAELTALPERAGPLQHPYLFLDADGLATFRRKAALPVFHPLAAGLVPRPADYDEGHLPPPGGRFAFDFDADSMHWGRVARETMLRDGEGRRRPAAARIWEWLPPAAKDAFRQVAGMDTARPDHLAVLLPAFNVLLRRPDLYDAEAFAGVRLPPEGVELLARGAAHLDDFELVKFNRILLQSSIECCHKFKVDLAARVGGYLAKWVLSGDPRLVALATRTAQAAADSMLTEPTFHLHEGNASPLLALAYDTFHPLLTEEQRGHWRRLLTKLLDLYLTSARAGEWTVTAIANANPVGNAGAGFLALALWQEEPEKAREAIGWIRRHTAHWLDYCFGPDGGNTEGCQYWQYGAESWIHFAALYERFFGCEDGLLDHPALRNGMNMIRVALCNDGALHGVNDTVPAPCGSELAWFWGGRYDDRFALWYGDHAWRWYQEAVADGRPTPYVPSAFWSILFRPEWPEVVEQPEPLPQAFALHSIEHGILRSGPEWNCRWAAGLKGSRPPYTHHNQADTGSFFIDLQGERLLIDPGYYKPEPGDHSLPIIGGVAPQAPEGYTGALIACESRGDVRYLACDATAAYRGAARRVVRHLVLVGDEGLVFLDDIVPTDPAAEIRAQYQCGGVTEAIDGGRAVLVRGRKVTLRLDLLTRPETALELRPERSLHDVHWGYHFAQCRLFPVTANYRADERDPLVTTFVEAGGVVPACRVERAGDELTVVMPSGRRVGFGWCEDGWRFNVEPAVPAGHKLTIGVSI